MVCPNCGKEVYEEQYKEQCQYCGAYCSDKSSCIGSFVGFFIPIVGLIMYFVCCKNYPQRSKSLIKGAVIGFILQISLISFICFAYYKVVYVAGITPDTISAIVRNTIEKDDDVKVEFGEYKEESRAVPVYVKNVGKYMHSFHITIEAMGPNGVVMETLFVDELKPGQEVEVLAFRYTNEEERVLLKESVFQVVDILRY